jgi:hypothetical protein
MMTEYIPYRSNALGTAAGKPWDGWFLAYALLWWFIIVVSVIDGYLMFEFQTHVRELNPIGQWLIHLNGGQVWYLLIAKFSGTVMASALLHVIYCYNCRAGIVIASVLAAIQGWLLLFLFCA